MMKPRRIRISGGLKGFNIPGRIVKTLDEPVREPSAVSDDSACESEHSDSNLGKTHQGRHAIRSIDVFG